MLDILSEDVLKTGAAARYLQERIPGFHVGPPGVWRWMTKGVTASDGTRVFLEHAKLGRVFVTSRQALSRFAARLAQSGGEGNCPDPSNTADIQRELEANGFYK